MSGGEEINLLNDNFYKYMASLFENGVLYCSAVAVSLKHLLTTASCIQNLIVSQDYRQFSNYFALVASDKNVVLPPYYFRQVEAYPEYNFKNPHPSLNIGIITLLVKIELSSQFFPLQWDMKNEKYNLKTIVPGWEITYYKNCNDTIMQYLNLKYVIVKTKSSCHIEDNWYPQEWSLPTNTFIGTTLGNSYLENTEVGSPVLSKIKLKIKGLISYMPENKTIPVVIVKTQDFKQWIERVKSDVPYEGPPCNKLTQPLTNLEFIPCAGSFLASYKIF